MTALRWEWLGRVAYAPSVATMESHRQCLIESAGGDDGTGPVLLLAEHPPVITLGRHANRNNLVASEAALAERCIDVVEVQRGGDVTYHGPGQLMIYPVVRVRPSVEALLMSIANVISDYAARMGVVGAKWQRDPAGVWIGDRKLAACGLHLAHGVSIHGFAFNLSTPMAAWRDIVPCGLPGHGVVSLCDAVPAGVQVPSVEVVARELGPRLARAIEELAPPRTQ